MYLEQVGLALSRLSMPSIHEGGSLDPQQEGEWSRQCTQCMAFVGALGIGGGNRQVTIPLMSRYRLTLCLCASSLVHFISYCCVPCPCSIKSIILQHFTKSPDSSVPWDQVVLTCVECILAAMDSGLWASVLEDSYHVESSPPVLPVEWLRAQADTSLSSMAHVADASISTPVPHRR